MKLAVLVLSLIASIVTLRLVQSGKAFKMPYISKPACKHILIQ